MGQFFSYLRLLVSKYGQKVLTLLQLSVSLATIMGLLLAYHSFNETLDLQKETHAIQLYSSYADLWESHPEYEQDTIAEDSTKWDDSYQMYAHRVLFLSESIINVREGSPEWENTVRNMLSLHLNYYRATDAVKNTFSLKFREFYRRIDNQEKRK